VAVVDFGVLVFFLACFPAFLKVGFGVGTLEVDGQPLGGEVTEPLERDLVEPEVGEYAVPAGDAEVHHHVAEVRREAVRDLLELSALRLLNVGPTRLIRVVPNEPQLPLLESVQLRVDAHAILHLTFAFLSEKGLLFDKFFLQCRVFGEVHFKQTSGSTA